MYVVASVTRYVTHGEYMAFVKLDSGLLRSSLWVERDHRSLFVTALLMAEPHEIEEPKPQLHVRSLEPTGWMVPVGWYGHIAAAGIGIVRQDGMERELGLSALEVLGSPDPESRSHDFDGRRLVRIDGGYLVLNYMKYRDYDHSGADRQRRLRERKKKAALENTENPAQNVTRESDGVTRDVSPESSKSRVTSRIADADADAEGREKNSTSTSSGPTVFHPDEMISAIVRRAPSAEGARLSIEQFRNGDVPNVPTPTPEQFGLALMAYSANGEVWNFSRFAGYVRRAVAPPEAVNADGHPKGGTGTTIGSNGKPDPAAVVLAAIRKLVKTVHAPAGDRKVIPRSEVAELGPDVLAAYDGIGGVDAIIGADPKFGGVLIRNFQQLLDAERAK